MTDENPLKALEDARESLLKALLDIFILSRELVTDPQQAAACRQLIEAKCVEAINAHAGVTIVFDDEAPQSADLILSELN